MSTKAVLGKSSNDMFIFNTNIMAKSITKINVEVCDDKIARENLMQYKKGWMIKNPNKISKLNNYMVGISNDSFVLDKLQKRSKVISGVNQTTKGKISRHMVGKAEGLK